MSRRLRLDVTAWGFLAAGMAVALCVFSYDPADPPEATVYPGHAATANLLGPAGAWMARSLYETFGQATYLFLAAWFVLVLFLFLRRNVLRWSARFTGWLVLLPASAAVADAVMPPQYAPCLGGAGGTLGAWLDGLLEAHATPLARAGVLAAAVSLGILLAADALVIPAFRKLSRTLLAALIFSMRATWKAALSASRLRWRRRGKEDPGQEAPALAESPKPAMAAEAPEPRRPPVPKKAAEIPIRYHDQGVAALGAAPAQGALPALAVASKSMEQDGDRFADFVLPPLTLLEEPQPFPYEEQDQRLRERAVLLEKTFADFGLNVRVVGINTGPVITQYEVALETGLRVHKVTGLSDDLALNLKVPSVRIVAPIPGKNTVGIEIPNEHRAVVRLKEVVLASAAKLAKYKIPLFLGKDTEGRPLVYDLAEMPHLLIAGRTGTGKSVCMNAIILSILMARRPDEVKMVMIDPKRLELSEYGRIPHLMHPVVKDMRKAEAILSWAVDKMEERYDLLSRARVRSIAAYNELSWEEIERRLQPADEEERKRIPERIPYIVIFVDEMNDLMMTMKKEVEGHIIRLAQKSRAAGIHLVVATQKPTVDVITGLIKSNLPARICFQVSSRSDSRVVLDEMGADKLLGKGDMLFLQPGTSTLVRSQGTYASDEEITRVVEHLECDPCYAQELIQLSTGDKDGGNSLLDNLRARDELYEQAIEVVLREGRGSVSLLQRALGIGHGRAARLIDFMAEDGIVGDYNGSQAREVLYTPEQWAEMKQAGATT